MTFSAQTMFKRTHFQLKAFLTKNNSSRDYFQQNMFSIEGILTEDTFSTDNFQQSTFSYLPTGGLGDISTPSENKTIILNLVKHLFHIIINTENFFFIKSVLWGHPMDREKPGCLGQVTSQYIFICTVF